MIASNRSTSLASLLEQRLGDPEMQAHLGEMDALVPPELWSRALVAPLRDFLGRVGKNFRARVVSLCWALAGTTDAPAPEPLGLIVEYIHAGSLIIDDIQDEALERRGAPSLHRIHGVPQALCVGNWLYFFPFAILRELRFDGAVELALHRHITGAMLRCHYGQALDLTVRSHAIEKQHLPDVVRAITRCKTEALFELAAACGALPAGAAPERELALKRFGARLGRALQNLDDLGSLRSPHRRAKRDEDLHGARATFAWALLAELLDDAAFARFQARARRCEEREEEPGALARDIVEVVAEPGDRRIRAELDAALGELRAAVGGSAVLGEVEAEIERLVQSYD